MPGFVYSNERPAQLHYLDGATYIPLPLWIQDEPGLQLAMRMIRARAFGSIAYSAFSLKVYTWYNSYSGDVESGDIPIFLSVAGTIYPNFGAGANSLGRAI